MEKISGILKSSSRVTSVDMTESGGLRPGTPRFGRSEGGNSLRDRANAVDGMEASARAQDTMMHWRTKEGNNTRAAEEIADRFFNSNQKEVAMKPISKQAPDRPVLGEADVDREPASDEVAPIENPFREQPVDSEFYPKGSFINAIA